MKGGIVGSVPCGAHGVSESPKKKSAMPDAVTATQDPSADRHLALRPIWEDAGRANLGSPPGMDRELASSTGGSEANQSSRRLRIYLELEAP